MTLTAELAAADIFSFDRVDALARCQMDLGRKEPGLLKSGAEGQILVTEFSEARFYKLALHRTITDFTNTVPR